MTFHTVTYCEKANKNVTIIYRHSGMLREGLEQSYERDWSKVTNEKNGGQGNKRALKEKEIEVSVEIVLKKKEGYVIKNYLYLINV